MKVLRNLALTATFLAISAVPAMAQSANQEENGSASITINEVLYLEVTNTSVSFQTPTETDFNTGSIAADGSGSVVSHRANVPHSVKLTSDTDVFGDSDPTDGIDKPATHLQWSKDNGASWVGLSTTGEDVVTTAPRGAHNNAETLQYQMILDYATDAPDTYTLDFTYTIVSG